MITPNTITRKQAKELVQLLNQWTRAEIMSRLGRFDNLQFADYFAIKIEKENEIRKMLFGTSDMVLLAEKLGLRKQNEQSKKTKKRTK